MKNFLLLSLAFFITLLTYGQCPTQITFTPASGCGIYEVHLNEFGEQGNIVWTYDDGQPLGVGYNNVLWASSTPGTHEVCAEAWTASCPNGITICGTIEVPNCNSECNVSLNTQAIDCDTYVFSITGADTGTVVWTFGDGNMSDGGLVADHNFSSNDTYLVSALYYGPACPLGVTLTTEVNVACETQVDCPSNIVASTGDACGVMNFEIGSFVEGEAVNWYPGDESGMVSGGHFFNHEYEQPGDYTVCAFYTSPACPNGVELCTEIYVEPCNNTECPQNITAEQIDCDSYVFHVDGVTGGEVSWSFGDNTGENSGINADHTFSSNGIYIVTAQYFSAACPNGTTLILTVIIDCNNTVECPDAIWSGVGDVCGVMNFEIGSFVEGESVNWYPGDESGMVSGGHFFSHQYEQPGVYTVCAFYTSPACPNGIELCTEIYVEPCNNTECPQNITAEQIDCDSYVFHVDGVTGGEVSWSFGDNTGENSGINADHTFSSNGIYIVTAQYFSAACPNGTTLILTVIIDCNNTVECPDAIWSGVGDACGVMNFEIGSFVEGESVNWYPGDESGMVSGGHFFSHQYEQPGVYTVCAFYTSPACPNGVELCTEIYIEPCNNNEECPTEITITPANCHQYIFEVNNWGNSLYGDILWNFGDNEGYGQNEFLHMYLAPGDFEVCVSGTTDLCPSGFEICTELNVNACGGDSDGNGCPDWIWGYPLNDCGLWTFEAGSFDSNNQSALWNWGDGTTSEGGTVMQHQYETDGLYVVTLTYSSAACEQAISINYTIEANACETSDCPQEIWSGAGAECGVILFEAGGFVEGESFVWYFGDGTVAEGGHYITHQYDEPGTYQVCCVLSNINCPGYQLCTTIVVEACVDDCTEAVLGIDSYVNNGGTPWLVYSIFSQENNTQIAFGEVNYTSEDPYFDIPVCLPDGCYTLTIDNNNPILIGQGLNLFLTAGDQNFLADYQVIYQDNISFTILFGVNSDCTENPNCEASFTPIYTNTPGHIEFQNNSVYDGTASFAWDYGDGQVSDGQWGNIWYENNGIYEVCLTVTTNNCTDTYCMPVSVQNMEVACTNNIIEVSVNAEYSINVVDMVDLALSYDGLEIETWTLPVTDGFTTSMALCVPDGCYELNLTTEIPLQAEVITATVTYNNTTINVAEFINNTSAETITFGLNTDCVIHVDQLITSSWNVFPNPSNGLIQIQANQHNEIRQIELFDSQGQLVMTYVPNSFSATIDLHSFADGLYFLKIADHQSSTTQRILLVK